MSGGWLIVPLENAGLGPAVNVRATVVLAHRAPEDRPQAGIGVIPAGRRAGLRFAVAGSLRDFELRLTFEDHLARPRRLTARWTVEDHSYSLDW